MNIKLKLLTALCVLLVQSVNAAGIPTVDIANITQTTVSAFENIEQVANQITQIENQINQFNKLQEQLSQQVAQFQSITGNYNMGTLLNSAAYQDARRFVPTSWQETLALMDGAAAAVHQVQTQEAALEARVEGERYTAPTLFDDIATPEAVRYIREANAVFTQLGVGRSNFDQSEQRVVNIEQLSAEIDSATDLKAAIDLQSRLIAEQAILTTELMKLQSAAHMNSAEQRLNEHNRRATDVAMASGELATIPSP